MSVPGGLSRNALLNLTGQVVQAAAWAAAFPFAVRTLGIERVGLLGLIWAVLSYATVFDWGLSRASTKLLAEVLMDERPDELARWAWTGILSQAVVGFSGTVVLLAVAALIPQGWAGMPATLIGEARTAFRIAAFGVPLVLVANGFQSVLEAGLRFGRVNMVKSTSGIASAAALLTGAALGFDLPGFTAALIAARVLSVLLLVALTIAAFPPMRRLHLPERAIVRQMLRFGTWVMISNWAGPLLLVGDRVLVAGLLPAQDLGYYTVPQELIIRLLILHASVAMAAYPAFSGLLARRDVAGVRRVWRESLLLMLLLAVGILAAGSLGGRLLATWIGHDVARGSGVILQVLAAGGALQGLAQLPVVLVQGAGKPDMIVKIQAAVIVPYLAVVVVLVRQFGAIGAAWAWTGRAALQAVVYYTLAGGLLHGLASGGSIAGGTSLVTQITGTGDEGA